LLLAELPTWETANIIRRPCTFS